MRSFQITKCFCVIEQLPFGIVDIFGNPWQNFLFTCCPEGFGMRICVAAIFQTHALDTSYLADLFPEVGQKCLHIECRHQLGYQPKLERRNILHSGSQKQPGESISLTFSKVQLLIVPNNNHQGMESAMVPSFSFLSPYLNLYHIGYGKRYSTPTKPNALPQSATHPYLVSTYTKNLLHEGGVSLNTPKLFFRKMENFFSIRKCINREKWKVHLPQCKAKLFFAVIFQICGC